VDARRITQDPDAPKHVDQGRGLFAEIGDMVKSAVNVVATKAEAVGDTRAPEKELGLFEAAAQLLMKGSESPKADVMKPVDSVSTAKVEIPSRNEPDSNIADAISENGEATAETTEVLAGDSNAAEIPDTTEPSPDPAEDRSTEQATAQPEETLEQADQNEQPANEESHSEAPLEQQVEVSIESETTEAPDLKADATEAPDSEPETPETPETKSETPDALRQEADEPEAPEPEPETTEIPELEAETEHPAPAVPDAMGIDEHSEETHHQDGLTDEAQPVLGDHVEATTLEPLETTTEPPALEPETPTPFDHHDRDIGEENHDNERDHGRQMDREEDQDNHWSSWGGGTKRGRKARKNKNKKKRRRQFDWDDDDDDSGHFYDEL